MISQLAQLIIQDNAILFVGSELSAGGQREPLVRRMAEALARRIDYAKPDRSLPAVARDFQALQGRNALLMALREEMERSAGRPDAIHQLIADAVLPQTKIITTRFDRILEQAFEAYQKPYVLIVRDSDVPFFDESKVTLIKIQGDISQPDSLVITEDDVNDFIDKLPTLSDLVRAFFATKTLIFLGYDLESDHFKRLFRQVTRNLSIYRRTAYAVLPEGVEQAMTEADRRYWASQSVEILAQEPMRFLEQLSGAVWAGVRQPQPKPPDPLDRLKQAPLPPTPYKGLNYFTQADAAIFLGRQQEIALLTNRALANRLTLLYGENGVGKSSLLRAGLPRALGERHAGLVILEPDPSQPLSQTLARALLDYANTYDLPMQPGQPPEQVIRLWQERLNGPVILAMDQAESFVQALAQTGSQEGDNNRGDDLDLLRRLLTSHSLDLRVILTLREEALGQAEPIQALLPPQQQARFRLERLGREAARESLTGSALLFGLEWSADALATLLTDLDEREAGGILPVSLQIVYQQMVRSAQSIQSSRLTPERLEALGGTRHILTAYLQESLESLPLAQQPLARDLLGCLVTTGGGKMRLELAELARFVGRPVAEVQPVLAGLDGRYLVRTLLPAGGEDGPIRYELAHAFLAQALSAWLGEHFWAGQKIREILALALPEWESRQRLLPEEDLALAQRLAPSLHPTPGERRLLYASALTWQEEAAPWDAALPGEERRDLLMALSRHPLAPARLAAARALAEFPTPESAQTLLGLALADETETVREASLESLARWSESPDAAGVAAAVQAIRQLSRMAQGQEPGHPPQAAWSALAQIRHRAAGSGQLLPPEVRRGVMRRVWGVRWRIHQLAVWRAGLRGGQGGFWGFGLGVGLFLGLSRFVADGFSLALIAQNMQSLIFGVSVGIPIMGVIGGTATGLAGAGARLFAGLGDGVTARQRWAVQSGLGAGLLALLWLLFAFAMPGELSAARSLAAGGLIGLGLYPAAGQPFLRNRGLRLALTSAAGVLAFLLANALGLIFVAVTWWLIWMGVAAGVGIVMSEE